MDIDGYISEGKLAMAKLWRASAWVTWRLGQRER